MTDSNWLTAFCEAQQALTDWTMNSTGLEEGWEAELLRRAIAVQALTPTQRPPRRMPTLWAIADAHDLGDMACCVKCEAVEEGGWTHASWWLDRAHVIDRCLDGLDVVANLRPLCRRCHRIQPAFKSGQEKEALAWFATPFVDEIVEIMRTTGGDRYRTDMEPSKSGQ